MQPITKNLYRFIWYFVKQFKWYFLIMAFCRLAVALDNLVVPYAFKIFLTKLTELEHDRSETFSKVGWPCFTLIGLVIWVDLMFRLYDYIKMRAMPHFMAKVRIWIVRYLQGHSYAFFKENFSGDLAKRTNDLTEGVAQIMLLLLSSFLPAFATMIIGVLSFAYIQPIFGAILMIWLILHATTYLLYAPRCNRFVALHAAKNSYLSGKIVDGFANILNIKLFFRKHQAIAHLSLAQKAEKEAYRTSLKEIMLLHFIINGLSIIFMGVGLILYMVYYWQRGKLTISDVTYIFYAGSNISNMVWLSVSEFPDLFEEVGNCHQALKFLQQAHTVTDMPNAAPLNCRESSIAFNQVSFSYSPNQILFKDQDIYIAAGEKVGLVGLSGSGKTTFIQLLLRFFDIDSGCIYIDNQDISSVTQDSLRAAIALIPQDTILFHSTILENIRYGRPEASDQEVITAAKQAESHDFIMHLSEGYKTLVGERGSKLSGGQRQRIAIARAILKDAPILIMDEATSALDSVTELAIQKSLATFIAEKTVLVIAHRISVLSAMDRILVFESGKIVSQGTHVNLLKTSTLYASICNLQLQGVLHQ